MAERLRERRQHAELEIKEAAHHLNVSYQYVRQLEEGINRPPAWPLLRAMAVLYKTNADYLLELTNDSRPSENNSLPEGGSELLEYLVGMSDRTQADLLDIAKVLYESDQEWQQYQIAEGFADALGGPEYVDQFNQRLTTLATKLGSFSAAIAHLRARLLSD